MTAAERVKKMRKDSGLSAQRFGDKYGIPLRTIQEWEAGRRNAPDYVIDLLAFAVASEKTVPMMYVFEKYRDKGGTGEQITFTSAANAVDCAEKEWSHLCEADRVSYRSDACGQFGVYLYMAGFDETDLEFVPAGDPIEEIWTALR